MGAGVAIPPWNFPLAILAGMTIGPVAAGNTMVVKPASNTPIIAAKFMEAVVAGGYPTRGGQLPSRRRRRDRRHARRQPPHPVRQLHRFQGGGAADRRPVGRGPSRPGLAEAGLHGDGRQGRDRRRRDRRPRRRRRRRGPQRLRLPGPEVLGVQPGDRGRRRPRRPPRTGCRPDRSARHRPARPTTTPSDRWCRRRSTAASSPTSTGAGPRPSSSSAATRSTGTAAGTSNRRSSTGSSPGTGSGSHEIFGPVLSVIRADDFDDAHRHRQRHRVRADRWGVLLRRGPDRTGPSRVPRRQPVHQPQDHRGAGGHPALRRVQALRLECQGRGTRLPPVVHRDEDGRPAGSELGAALATAGGEPYSPGTVG